MTLLSIEIHFTYSRWLSPLFWLFVYYEGNLESSSRYRIKMLLLFCNPCFL